MHARTDINPKVSVLMATRNRSHSLQRALKSVCRQSCYDIEILIADDASADDTVRVLHNAAAEDSRIRIFRNEKPIGLPASLNRLLGESRGNYIARMDDDDVAYPERFKRQIQFMQQNDIQVCGTWYRRISSWGRSIIRTPEDDETIRTELLFQPPLLHPSVMICRTNLIGHGGYDTGFPYAEDYELWARIAPHVRFGNVPEVLLDYSISKKQVSKRFNKRQIESAMLVRARYLTQMGIPYNQSQLIVHGSLRAPTPIRSLHELRACENWLQELVRHFSPRVKPVFSRQWYLTAVRAASLGPAAFRVWKRSSLANGTALERQTQLALLTLVRLRYGSQLYQFLENFSNG